MVVAPVGRPDAPPRLKQNGLQGFALQAVFLLRGGYVSDYEPTGPLTSSLKSC